MTKCSPRSIHEGSTFNFDSLHLGGIDAVAPAPLLGGRGLVSSELLDVGTVRVVEPSGGFAIAALEKMALPGRRTLDHMHADLMRSALRRCSSRTNSSPTVSGMIPSSGGCVPPAPTPIAPTLLHVAHTPTEVVQIATRELVAQGFEVSVSDAAAGTVVTKRVRSPDAQGDEISCRYAHGSIAGKGAEATMTVSVSAKDATSGADVVITSLVRSDFSKLPGVFARGPSNDTDCVSSGVVEKRLAESLR